MSKRKFTHKEKLFTKRKKLNANSRVNIPAIIRARKAEIKTIDTLPLLKSISTTAVFTLLNGVQEGAGFNNRVGRKIMMRSVRITGNVFFEGGGAGNSSNDYVRIMIVYDRQPNGAVPAIADILASQNDTTTVDSTAWANLNMNNAERFYVIRDKRIALQNFNGGALSAGTVNSTLQTLTESSTNIDMFVKLKGLETHFKSSSNPAVVADIASGSLYLITYGINSAANAGWAFTSTSRVRYHDM